MKTIGYIRVSTEEQSQKGISLDMQEKAIRDFARSQGWEVAEVLKDKGFSAKSLKRPAIQKLLDLIPDQDQRGFDTLLVYKVDRLTRRQKDLQDLLSLFDEHNLAFKSISEPFDTCTGIGKALLGMIGVFAQLERDMIGDRTKDALNHKAENGEYYGGRPALGYKSKSKALKEDKRGLRTYQLIKELRGRGRHARSYAKIAEELNSRGIKPAGGGSKWHGSTVHYILKNPIYKGNYRNGNSL